MQEVVNRMTPVSFRSIAHPRNARWLAVVALSLPWLSASRASTPTTGQGCTSGQEECASIARPKVVIDAGEWKNAVDYLKPSSGDPRNMMVLIQSNMDRISADQPVWPAPDGVTTDPLLQIVNAYTDFLHGDFKSMDASIATAEQAADKLYLKSPWKNLSASDKNAFYTSFTAASQNTSPLVRLYAALRYVDGSLFGMLGNPYTREIPVMRGDPSPLNDTWVSLPCRTVIGRLPQFVAATNALKSLGGPVLDCPVDGPVDYAKDEMLALHPWQLSPHVTPPVTHNTADTSGASAPPQPGSRDAALDEMDTHPQQAEPILEHYAHVDALGKLDYALFLHAFKPRTPARDATIRALQDDLQKRLTDLPRAEVAAYPPTPYDGTDASLLSIIQMASLNGVANSESSFYAIPCTVLISRPALIAATDEYYGSNMDNFMPRSGCDPWWGRGGKVTEFPDKAVDAFKTASTEADGNFIATEQGSMVYGFEARQNFNIQRMRIDPRYFLNPDPLPEGYPTPSFDYPYQVWGYTSLNNYVVSQHLRKLYIAARDQLANYYRKHMKLNRADSEQAAKAALFVATWGANCGGDVPSKSLRRMLLEHASLHDITQQLDENGDSDAAEVEACSKYADHDPLLLVAVADPEAFPLIMQHQPNINERNAIGKTALMEATQFDQASLVNLLLEHHAAINAMTQGGLAYDARTALMYAAANGSLDLIKALLDAGADPYQADTKGHRAIDYLLGYGPTPPNSRLSKAQREQAAQWLF